MPLLRSGVLCYTIAKQPEQFRCGTKLCHADAGRFYATAPLCISCTVPLRTCAFLSDAFALPRLALPRRCNSTALLNKSTALGFHATAPRFAIPEHRNADAICCFSYAVYYVAFAMPHQSHARQMQLVTVHNPCRTIPRLALTTTRLAKP